MTAKTQCTGQFFLENEPHILMEIQKRFLDQKNEFWTRKRLLGPMFSFEQKKYRRNNKNIIKSLFSMVYIEI